MKFSIADYLYFQILLIFNIFKVSWFYTFPKSTGYLDFQTQLNVYISKVYCWLLFAKIFIVTWPALGSYNLNLEQYWQAFKFCRSLMLVMWHVFLSNYDFTHLCPPTFQKWFTYYMDVPFGCKLYIPQACQAIVERVCPPTFHWILLLLTLDNIQDLIFIFGIKPNVQLCPLYWSKIHTKIKGLKIINTTIEDAKIIIFKVIFQCWKSIESSEGDFLLKILPNFCGFCL